MAKLVNITETPEAITAEAVAYVWEEYDAPRKRIKRARIVEHPFAVSIPKYTEEAAPLAFVVEYFPQMVGDEYRAGHDEQIRHAGGKFYTRARYCRHSYYSDQYRDPATELQRAISCISDVTDREREEYAEAIARDEMRADQWPTLYDRAERIDENAPHYVKGLAVIAGELWHTCEEPVYEYHSAWRSYGSKRETPAYISVNNYDHKHRNTYGAMDRAALAYYHAGVTRTAFIRVLRPDLVTIDSTARDLAADSDRAAEQLAEARAALERLEKELAEARASLESAAVNANKAREKCENYAADPRAYWMEKAAYLESADPAKPFGARRSRAAAAVRRALDMEA